VSRLHGVGEGVAQAYRRGSQPILFNHSAVSSMHVVLLWFVFTTDRRGPIRDDNWRKRVWKPLIKSVPSIPDKTRFHDLRHTHVALCISKGVNFKSIQTRLGHSSIRVTMDRYGHLLESLRDQDMASLDTL
jgi:integrase